MSEVVFSEAELAAIETLATAGMPAPRTRCPLCQRRVNAPRQDSSPDTREMRIKLPTERMEAAEEAFDALQQVVGADPYSYPRGVLLELMLVIAGQRREELKAYFEGTD